MEKYKKDLPLPSIYFENYFKMSMRVIMQPCAGVFHFSQIKYFTFCSYIELPGFDYNFLLHTA